MSLLHRVLASPGLPVPPEPRVEVLPPTVAAPAPVSARPSVVQPATKAAGGSLMQMLFGQAPRLTEDEVDDAAERRGGEVSRVLGLPMAQVCDVDLTDELRLPHGTMRLRPIQSQCLQMARERGGVFGLIGVGHGKTLISALLPTVMQAKLAVLLVPAPLVAKTLEDLKELRRHWNIVPPERLHVISFSRLSTKSDLLERMVPDLIIADEAHMLKDAKSARTKRFLRYFKLYKSARFVGLSGTMTNRSLMDYWHLARLALGEHSPVPLSWAEVGLWDVVFGSMEETRRRAAAASGARIALPGPEAERVERRFLRWAEKNRTRLGIEADVELTSRLAFSRRMRTIPGVAATSEGGCDASLQLQLVQDIAIPPVVAEAIAKLDDTWCIGEEELDDPMRVADCRRRLVCGYWYRWVWPESGRDEEWLDARSSWARAVRGYLKGRATTGYDSPGLLAAAAARRDARVKSLWPDWDRWCEVKHRPAPPTETVWLDRYLVDWAIAQGNESPSVVFYSGKGFEAALREAGCRVYGPGDHAHRELVAHAKRVLDGDEQPTTIYCNVTAHGTGKNLQGWSRMVVAVPPTDGKTWEQMLGRLHRPGQRADTVEVVVAAHAKAFVDTFESASRDARYIDETTGQAQKLVFADVIR